MIEEQNAVQVIDLVLNRARLVAACLDARAVSVSIEGFDDDLGGAGHFAEDLGNREASLLGRLRLVAALDDDGIDEDERGWIVYADVDDCDAPRDADLGCGEADTLRV